MKKLPVRTTVIHVRLTREERKTLKQKASEAVKTVSAYIREKALS